MKLERKHLAEYRERQLEKQMGFDPITGTKITAPTLDHDHESGHCRKVLQREVNSAEGKMYNAWKRYIRHLGIPFTAFLMGLVRYHQTDFTANPIHPEHKTSEEKRIRRNKKARALRALKKETI